VSARTKEFHKQTDRPPPGRDQLSSAWCGSRELSAVACTIGRHFFPFCFPRVVSGSQAVFTVELPPCVRESGRLPRAAIPPMCSRAGVSVRSAHEQNKVQSSNTCGNYKLPFSSSRRRIPTENTHLASRRFAVNHSKADPNRQDAKQLCI
jgi:hypothetical protein